MAGLHGEGWPEWLAFMAGLHGEAGLNGEAGRYGEGWPVWSGMTEGE